MIHNPFTREPMISVENGSMADFFQHGGKEEDIITLARQASPSSLEKLPIRGTRRISFDWPDQNVDNCVFDVYVWVLRIKDDGDNDDFRWFYSSQGVHEELVLRGWND